MFSAIACANSSSRVLADSAVSSAISGCSSACSVISSNALTASSTGSLAERSKMLSSTDILSTLTSFTPSVTGCISASSRTALAIGSGVIIPFSSFICSASLSCSSCIVITANIAAASYSPSVATAV